MAGLCIFKLYAVIIKSLAGDNGHAVIVIQINVHLINLSYSLNGERALAGGDCKTEFSFQIFID